MTYDQHGPWSGPGPIGAMPWVRKELRYFVTRVPRRKVDLGAAAYGYRWGAARRSSPAAGPFLAGSRAAGKPDSRRVARHPPRRTPDLVGRRALVDLRRTLAAEQGLHGLAIWQIGSSGRLQP